MAGCVRCRDERLKKSGCWDRKKKKIYGISGVLLALREDFFSQTFSLRPLNRRQGRSHGSLLQPVNLHSPLLTVPWGKKHSNFIKAVNAVTVVMCRRFISGSLLQKQVTKTCCCYSMHVNYKLTYVFDQRFRHHRCRQYSPN